MEPGIVVSDRRRAPASETGEPAGTEGVRAAIRAAVGLEPRPAARSDATASGRRRRMPDALPDDGTGTEKRPAAGSATARERDHPTHEGKEQR